MQPLNFVDRKKNRKFGKTSPKIKGWSQHDQFWNLSSPMDPASRDTKIAPLDALGAEKLGVSFDFDLKFLQRGALPPPSFIFLESSHRAL